MVVADRTSDGGPILGPDALAHLRVPPTGMCWWCHERRATTGEHKFKRADLTRLMAGGGPLLWGDRDGNTREIRGASGVRRDRYGVIKFPKSLCEPCNNKRSKPFDNAYDVYSRYVDRTWLRIMPGVDFRQIFGTEWEACTLHLARYYGKHFGCRMVRAGLPVPDSLREFLDGGTDMPDAHMALITTDTVHKFYKGGLSISPDFVEADKNISRFVRYVLVAYVGSIGVRYEWSEEDFPERSQFFQFPHPIINCFEDEIAVCEGRARRPGWFASILQWANRRASSVERRSDLSRTSGTCGVCLDAPQRGDSASEPSSNALEVLNLMNLVSAGGESRLLDDSPVMCDVTNPLSDQPSKIARYYICEPKPGCSRASLPLAWCRDREPCGEAGGRLAGVCRPATARRLLPGAARRSAVVAKESSVGVEVPGAVLFPQRVDGCVPPLWPGTSIVHLDLTAGDVDAAAERAVALGATLPGAARPCWPAGIVRDEERPAESRQTDW